MKKSICVDYLQYSCDYEHAPVTVESVQETPIRNYKSGVRNIDGSRVYFGNANSKRPLVIYAGEAMQDARQFRTEEEILNHVIGIGGTVSRLDLAIDFTVDDDEITLEDVAQWWRDNQIISSFADRDEKLENKCKPIGEITDEGISFETLYIGNREKRSQRGIVRVYRRDFKLTGLANKILRFEVESKKKQAHNMAKRLALGEDMESLFRARFDVNNEKWRNAMTSPIADVSRGVSEEKQAPDTWKWLFDVVAPSLGRAIASEALQGSKSKYELFNSIVQSEYNQVINKALEHIKLDKE